MRFCELLSQARHRVGASQDAVALHLGISRTLISDYEMGRRPAPVLPRVRSFARFYDLSEAETDRLLAAAIIEQGGIRLPIDGEDDHDALRLALALISNWHGLEATHANRMIEVLNEIPSS